MNIIKSYEWELLSNVIRKEDPDTINFIMDFIIEETLRYEEGEASYPRIDFAVAVAIDRKNEELKNKEKLLLKPIVPVLKLKPPVIVKEPTTPELSPTSKKNKVRESWIKKFEKEAKEKVNEKIFKQLDSDSDSELEIVKTPQLEFELKPEVVKKPIKKIIKRRVIKKNESEKKN
jgi:hypothetical protein